MKKLLVSLALIISFSSAANAQQSFADWKQGVIKEAVKNGVSERVVQNALQDVQYIPRIIELDRKQPEGTMTFAKYRENIVNKRRIEDGRALYSQHKALLDATGERYGVQPQYIVALWGLETNYGSNTGGYGVVESLSTLAYDGRRSEFFRKELMAALKILQDGHIDNASMKGSWAGAMGQPQFMPSSFMNLAVDGNGDGRKDIWTSLPDVFASAANYLSTNGWKGDERWGREVRVPESFPESLSGVKIKKSLQAWKNMGVTLPSGEPIPVIGNMQASVVMPDGKNGPAFLTYKNYDVIMSWNRSTYFATSISLLADAIAR